MQAKTLLTAAFIPVGLSLAAAFPANIFSGPEASVAMGTPALTGGAKRSFVDSSALPPTNAYNTGLSGGFKNATGLRVDGIAIAIEAKDPAVGIPTAKGDIVIAVPHLQGKTQVRKTVEEGPRGYGVHIDLKGSEIGSLASSGSLDFYAPVESASGDLFTYYVPTIALPGESEINADVLDGCELSAVAPGAIKSMARPFHRFAAVKVQHSGEDNEEVVAFSGSVHVAGSRLKSIALHHTEQDLLPLVIEHSIAGEAFSISKMDSLEAGESCVLVLEFDSVPSGPYEVTIKADY